MKKCVLILMLAVALCLSFSTVGALAAESSEEIVVAEEDIPEITVEAEQESEVLLTEASGSCGENLTWSLEEGVLTISGTGAMTDYARASATPWNARYKEITAVVIESGVTSVGSYAFAQLTRLVSVAIPSSVTSIGSYAFSSCESLESISIPDGVTVIGQQTFYKCYKLESISIPDGVTAIGKWAFKKCTALESVVLPDSVTSIEAYAFDGCTSLADVYYGGSEVQWDKISIASANKPLTAAAIHFGVPNIAGDANGDGSVDILDVIHLLWALARTDVKVYGDVTGDETLNEMDVVRLMHYLVGEDVEVY